MSWARGGLDAGRSYLLLCAALFSAVVASGKVEEVWGYDPTTWVATDGLGRELPGFDVCGPERPGKFVGIFYFLWLGAHEPQGPYDLTQIRETAEADRVYGPEGAFHFWGEPELGYYRSEDAFVLRRHATMLSDAGVDVIAIDVTNVHIYERQFEALCETWMMMRDEGAKTPQVMFLAHSKEQEVVETLFRKYYEPGKYKELWFYWEGKPLILASPDGHSEDVETFFSFRKSWAWSATPWFGDGRGKWPWLDNTPQRAGLGLDGEKEQVSVSVAQHATSNIGRSFTNGEQPEISGQEPGVGAYFAEQWERALELDPDFIFVTGWNEWVAQRFVFDGKIWTHLVGEELEVGDSVFVDAYSQEYSRDIEPMKEGHSDNYYYQMVAGIRRFKGVSDPRFSSGEEGILIDGEFDDWKGVNHSFVDSVGDSIGRDFVDYGGSKRLRRESAPYDIDRCKASWGKETVFFYVASHSQFLTGGDFPSLWLYLDSDGDNRTGWLGYDHRVEIYGDDPGDGRLDAELERFDERLGGWSERRALSAFVAGDEIELQIPKSEFEVGTHLDFHWLVGPDGGLGETALLSAVESAPNRRFNFRLRWR